MKTVIWTRLIVYTTHGTGPAKNPFFFFECL